MVCSALSEKIRTRPSRRPTSTSSRCWPIERGWSVAEHRVRQLVEWEGKQRLAELSEQQRELLSELAGMETRERLQMAESIHDEPIQLIVAAAMRIDFLRNAAPGGDERVEPAGHVAGIVRGLAAEPHPGRPFPAGHDARHRGSAARPRRRDLRREPAAADCRPGGRQPHTIGERRCLPHSA